jgi:hypothetical protein
MVALVTEATGEVVILKVPVFEPPAMLKLAGTMAALGVSLDKATVKPAGGAEPFSTTVPIDPLPPVTAPGLNTMDMMVAGKTVSVAAKLRLPPELALTIALTVVVTPIVVAANVCVLLPAGMVTPAGTVTDGSELDSETKTPPAGATTLMTTVPVEEAPPGTLGGLKLTRTTGGGSTDRFWVIMAAPVVAVIVT